MWLLDANMDVHLIRLLDEFGIRCEAATARGWGSLHNGELVAAAAQGGFSCLLTQDRLFAESAREALAQAPGLGLVVIRLPQRPWREYVQQFRAEWVRHPIEPLPRAVVIWPAGD